MGSRDISLNLLITDIMKGDGEFQTNEEKRSFYGVKKSEITKEFIKNF